MYLRENLRVSTQVELASTYDYLQFRLAKALRLIYGFLDFKIRKTGWPQSILILLTSVGIEPTNSGLDLPLVCRLSYEVVGRLSYEVGDDLGGESRRRESKGVFT